MSYIGKSPSIGSYSMLDSLTASATASYSLTLDSVAFVPESANHLIVSLNGVIQKAGSSFTVSSSTLTFSSALTSSDSIDFVLALGNVLDIGTPSDSTVTNAKTNFVSTSSAAGLQIKGDGTTDGTLQLNCSQNSHGIKLKSPAHSAGASYTLTFPTTDGSANEFLKTDGSGVLSWGSAGGTNTPAFHAKLSSTQTPSNDTEQKINVNTEDFDTANAYDNSSNYRFTPQTAGKYFVYGQVTVYGGDVTRISVVQTRLKKNGSTVFYNNQDTRAYQSRGISSPCNAIIDFNGSSDYVELHCYISLTNTSGSQITGDSSATFFGAYKLIE